MNHLFRLRRFMRPYLRQISGNLLVLLAATGLGLIVPLILQNVIDDGLLRGDIGYILRDALLLGLGLITAVLNLAQRQLISFARALLANPRLLILDEATSFGDTHTELSFKRRLWPSSRAEPRS